MEQMKRFIDCGIGTYACNLRCHYCYVAQNFLFTQKVPNFKYSAEHVGRSLSKERLGGTCMFNICASGETLIPHDVVDYAKAICFCFGRKLACLCRGTVCAHDMSLHLNAKGFEFVDGRFYGRKIAVASHDNGDLFCSNICHGSSPPVLSGQRIKTLPIKNAATLLPQHTLYLYSFFDCKNPAPVAKKARKKPCCSACFSIAGDWLHLFQLQCCQRKIARISTASSSILPKQVVGFYLDLIFLFYLNRV